MLEFQKVFNIRNTMNIIIALCDDALLLLCAMFDGRVPLEATLSPPTTRRGGQSNGETSLIAQKFPNIDSVRQSTC